MNSKGSKWLRGCGIALLILFVLLAGGILIARYLYRQYMLKQVTPAEYAEMQRFFEEPVEIPDEWRQVNPFPPELLRQSEDFYDRWIHLTRDKQSDSVYFDHFNSLQNGKKLNEDEWEEIERALNINQGFSDDLAALVATEGYELEAFPRSSLDKDLPDLLLVFMSAKHLCLEAHWLARQGRWEEAFERALTVLRLTKRHPTPVLITRWIAIPCEEMFTETLAALAQNCNNPVVLRSALEKINRIDPLLNLTNLDDAHLVEIVGDLREFQRKGKKVDLSKRAPRGYFFQQWVEMMEEESPPGCGDTFSSWRVLAFILGPRTVLEMLYIFTTLNMEEAHTQQQTAKAKFDLARIALASRITQLETSETPASIQDLVPKYFANSPGDPFSNNPYLNDSSRQVFYSIGPDGRDDGNGFLYDPTNGILSNGDISLGTGGSR